MLIPPLPRVDEQQPGYVGDLSKGNSLSLQIGLGVGCGAIMIIAVVIIVIAWWRSWVLADMCKPVKTLANSIGNFCRPRQLVEDSGIPLAAMGREGPTASRRTLHSAAGLTNNSSAQTLVNDSSSEATLRVASHTNTPVQQSNRRTWSDASQRFQLYLDRYRFTSGL